jgi:hypothetical protein
VATYIPALKCVKTVLSYTYGGALSVSNRFFMTYSGAAPAVGDLEAVAAAVGAQWSGTSAGFYSSAVELTIIECTDLTSETSLSESATVLATGTRDGTVLSANDAVVVSMPTGRRYRGGHSRVYLPAGVAADQSNDISWADGFATDVADDWAALIEAGAAAIWGAGGSFTNVMTSFYDGFTNVPYGTPTKYRRVPTGRDTAAFFEVTGYFGRDKIGSQRRRLDSA